MPKTPLFDYTISQDSESVTLSLDGINKTLSTQDVIQLILWLGQVRSEMKPEVSKNFQLQEVCCPTDILQVLPMIQGTSEQKADILVRSPHYGWLKHTLSDSQVKQIIEILQHPELLIPSKSQIN